MSSGPILVNFFHIFKQKAEKYEIIQIHTEPSPILFPGFG